MMYPHEPMVDFRDGTMSYLAGRLLETEPLHTGEWQSKDVSKIKQYATHELVDTTLYLAVPPGQEAWLKFLGDDVNYSWAEEHFLERVGGVPVNPAPSHERWPWSHHNGNHQTGPRQVFSHTYPERIWPRHANGTGVEPYGLGGIPLPEVMRGIRFDYGDLQDVVDLLVRSPLTRQAYLPIWFPEDTGVAHRQRVPCTLGYHFMIRGGQLSCRYYMRSCDLIRHLPDDIYMAGRLMQWMCEQINMGSNNGSYAANVDREHLRLIPGSLVMHIASLHAFLGDQHKLKEIAGRSVNGSAY